MSARAAATAWDNAATSTTSTTTGSTPAARSASAFAADRVVPTTEYWALSSSGTSRLPIAPVAPARKILTDAHEHSSRPSVVAEARFPRDRVRRRTPALAGRWDRGHP